MLGNLIVTALLISPPNYGQSSEARFWLWFQAHDAALFFVVTGKEPVCAKLKSELRRIQPDLTFEFGPVESGRREFVLSANGIREAFPAVISLAAAAPVLTRWTIIRFRPARPQFTKVRFGGLELDAGSVLFAVAYRNGDRANLVISVPGYRATPRKVYEQAVFLLLDRMVGEYAAGTGIGTVFVTAPEHRPLGRWLALTRLQEAIRATPIKVM
jgi:hypothetical protein